MKIRSCSLSFKYLHSSASLSFINILIQESSAVKHIGERDMQNAVVGYLENNDILPASPRHCSVCAERIDIYSTEWHNIILCTFTTLIVWIVHKIVESRHKAIDIYSN